jgi:MAF protein
LNPLHGGLTAFGREVVGEMNRLGMLVDVSHVSDDCFRHVLETSTSPVIASHSSCRGISPHRRNLADDMLRGIAATGGVIQINFAAAFVDPAFPPIDPEVLEYWSTRGGFAASPYAKHNTTLDLLADHFDHAIKVVGYNHVGIGSDFDGVAALPRGMDDCSRLPYLTAELLRRGHREADLRPVLGENFLRVLQKCQNLGGLQVSHCPSLPSGGKSAVAEEGRGEGQPVKACSSLKVSTDMNGFVSRHERLFRRDRLILASASPRRAQILRELGLAFEVVAAKTDESPVPGRHSEPAQWAEEVSLMKARDVAGQVGEGLILAGDTVAALGDRIIGKPADRAHARRILETLMGTDHRVITALTLLDARTGRSLTCHDVTLVRMRKLSAEELDAHLDSGQWQGKAGAYGIQDHDDPFVASIQGSFTNVVGLPVELLEQMLQDWACTVTPARGASMREPDASGDTILP